ncbi:HAMP domain-containing protein [Roseibium salinum]|nr:HAMP domain-containing protein [Roseibium salinum]
MNNHKVVQPIYKEMIDQGLFSDAALANPEGFIAYTYKKGPEFAHHVDAPEIQGHPTQIAFGKLFEASRNETLAAGQIYSSGFVVDSEGKVSLALAAPVFYLDRFFGAIALSADMERLAAMLNEPTGLGESEQIFLVDAAGELVHLDASGRANAVHKLEDIAAGNRLIALDGNDFRYAEARNTFENTPYGVVDAIRQTELSAAANRITYGAIVSGFLCLIPIVGLIWWITRRMFAPMERLSDAARKIADGDLEVTVEATDRQDEIGRMARCIEVFQEKLGRARTPRCRAQGRPRCARKSGNSRSTRSLRRSAPNPRPFWSWWRPISRVSRKCPPHSTSDPPPHPNRGRRR